MSVFHVELKWLRDRAARLTATSIQINGPCGQLQSKKASHCAQPIRPDVGLGLRMQERFSCSCYDALLARWQVLKSAGICQIIALLTCLQKRMKDSRWVIASYLQCSSAESGHANIWPMIENVDGVQRFDTELLSSWASRHKIHSSNFVLQELRLTDGWKTSKKPNTNIQWISKLETISVFHVELKWFRDRAAILTATCNQINGPCEQLPSKKTPHSAWSIGRDVGEVLHMQETFSCSYYGALLARWQVRKSPGIWRVIALLT